MTFTGPLVLPCDTTATIRWSLQLLTAARVPLKFTLLSPCDVPKPVPAMVTDVPGEPAMGEMAVIESCSTLNATPLLVMPARVNVTLPLVAVCGTVTFTKVSLKETILVAWTPLNCMELAPWVAPKPVPCSWIRAPVPAAEGTSVVITGFSGVKIWLALLEMPLTTTVTGPTVAVAGTVATTEVDVQLPAVGVTVTPLNFTILESRLVPKFVPVMVIGVPTAPELCERLVTLGVASTLNSTPLLAAPLTVATMLPLVAPLGTGTTISLLFQLVGVAVTPLNVTVLLPCGLPKPTPLIVTLVPAKAEAGLIHAIEGVAIAAVPVVKLDEKAGRLFPTRSVTLVLTATL